MQTPAVPKDMQTPKDTSQKGIEYFSQNPETCGEEYGKSCGVVSLANCLRRLLPSTLPTPTPLDIIKKCTQLSLFDEEGLPPNNLYVLCDQYKRSISGLTVEYSAGPLTGPKISLTRGALMYVNSLELLNAQGGNQVPTSQEDSHVVFVEDILSDGTVVVINPDRAKDGSEEGFSENQWGRMEIPEASLERVWQSMRRDGTKTTRCAIFLVI